jgi:hypothetical protein
VSYDDASNADPHVAEIRVVDVPAGRVEWRIALPPRPNVDMMLTAALSVDGSALAVQHGNDLMVYRRTGDGWQRKLDTQRLAGPAAWTPDGRRLTVTSTQGQFTLLDAATGNPMPERKLPTIEAQPFEQPGAKLVTWRGDTPVLVIGNRLLLLTDEPRVLLTAPAGIRELEIATDRIGEPPHQPGPPRPGPFAQRYRPIITVLGTLASLATLALVSTLRRRRRARL